MLNPKQNMKVSRTTSFLKNAMFYKKKGDINPHSKEGIKNIVREPKVLLKLNETIPFSSASVYTEEIVTVTTLIPTLFSGMQLFCKAFLY